MDYRANRRIDVDVMLDSIHPLAVHSIPPLCKPAAQLHFHQEILDSRCIAQLIYNLNTFHSVNGDDDDKEQKNEVSENAMHRKFKNNNNRSQ